MLWRFYLTSDWAILDSPVRLSRQVYSQLVGNVPYIWCTKRYTVSPSLQTFTLRALVRRPREAEIENIVSKLITNLFPWDNRLNCSEPKWKLHCLHFSKITRKSQDRLRLRLEFCFQTLKCSWWDSCSIGRNKSVGNMSTWAWALENNFQKYCLL